VGLDISSFLKLTTSIESWPGKVLVSLLIDSEDGSKFLTRSRYETVVKRWPVILTQIIDHLNRTNHELTLQINHEDEINVRQKIEEGKTIIQKIGTLKYKMGRDHAIECVIRLCIAVP